MNYNGLLNFITNEKLEGIRRRFSDNPLVNFIDNDRFYEFWSEIQQLNTWIETIPKNSTNLNHYILHHVMGERVNISVNVSFFSCFQEFINLCIVFSIISSLLIALFR